MANFFKKLILGNTLKPVGEGPLSRQELVNQIYDHFMRMLKSETTTEGLLFHTSYYIYLKEADYVSREQSFPNTIDDVMKKINREIDRLRKKKKYRGYRPHSEYWQFQFLKLTDGMQLQGVEGQPSQGGTNQQLVIFSFVYPEKKTSSRESREQVVTTVHVGDTVSVEQWAINREALNGISMVGRDRFVVPFGSTQTIQSYPSRNGGNSASRPFSPTLATLRVMQSNFIVNNTLTNTCRMNSESIQVSGRNDVDNRGGMMVIKVDSDKLANPHFTIQHKAGKAAGDHKFFLFPHASLRLNDQYFNDTSNQWVPLPNNSDIIIDEIQIRFSVNP